MNRIALAMMLLAASTEPQARTHRRLRDHTPGWGPKPSGPITVACPRCKAAVGERCDQRTLGRHLYHRARVDAVEEQCD